MQALGNSQANEKARNARRAIESFLKSRPEGTSEGTLSFYSKYLSKSIPSLGLTPESREIEAYLNALPCSVGGKQAYYRAISVFYNWLYHPKSNFKLETKDNPMIVVAPPKRPKLILPSLSKEQVLFLLEERNTRDKAIISLFVESGLRLAELTNIKPSDISWGNRIIRTLGKGNKEAYAPFGALTEKYLRAWLSEYKPNGNVWGIGYWGIKTMLDDLKLKTGLPCNPHTFRRTFACLLRKSGIDALTIKDLGRWESLEMVQRYT
jgi:site-specific recombinase XerD